MELLIICAVIMLGFGWLAMELLAMALLRKCFDQIRDRDAQKPAAAEELPEEAENRRLAVEAQRLYEQGFVNLMRYDGSPGRKESEL